MFCLIVNNRSNNVRAFLKSVPEDGNLNEPTWFATYKPLFTRQTRLICPSVPAICMQWPHTVFFFFVLFCFHKRISVEPIYIYFRFSKHFPMVSKILVIWSILCEFNTKWIHNFSTRWQVTDPQINFVYNCTFIFCVCSLLINNWFFRNRIAPNDIWLISYNIFFSVCLIQYQLQNRFLLESLNMDEKILA